MKDLELSLLIDILRGLNNTDHYCQYTENRIDRLQELFDSKVEAKDE
jgi:hypothetical protein